MSRRYMTLSIMYVLCRLFWCVLCRKMLYTEEPRKVGAVKEMHLLCTCLLGFYVVNKVKREFISQNFAFWLIFLNVGRNEYRNLQTNSCASFHNMFLLTLWRLVWNNVHTYLNLLFNMGRAYTDFGLFDFTYLWYSRKRIFKLSQFGLQF